MSTLPAIMYLTSAAVQTGTGVMAHVQAAREARQLEKMGKIEAESERKLGRKVAGAQRAAYGKAGVRISAGTPLQIAMETAETAELNALRQRFYYGAAAQRARQYGQMLFMQSILGATAAAARGMKAWPTKPTAPTYSTKKSALFDWLEASGGGTIA